MQKSNFERFITKYNLSGASEGVEMKMEKGTLFARFVGDDKNCMGFVSTPNVDLEEGTYCVLYTTNLLKMLAVLGDGISITVKKVGDQPVAFVMNDGRNKATFTLADPGMEPTIPTVNMVPDWDVEIRLTQEFMTAFTRAKNAMTEVDVFTVLSDGKSDVQLALGHSETQNTNSVTLKCDAITSLAIRPMNFSTRYLREIFAANKEAQTGVLKVSEMGAAFITFDISDFKVEYWIMEKE